MNPDAGTGTLQGNVLLLADESFVQYALYAADATVTADGASGSPVTAAWHGAGLDPDPFLLEGVAKLAVNWVSVTPAQVGGEAMLTYQAVPTNQGSNLNGLLVSSAILDSVFTFASTLRSPDSGQVILFFRSAGTGVPLPGLHVSMAKAQVAMYATASGWVLDDGTAVTDKSGLVMFGNVEPANAGGMQTVIVTRAATGTTPAAAAGQFPVKVVKAAATIAGIDVQL